MTNLSAWREFEAARVNPPYLELVDEKCDGGDHDLDDTVYLDYGRYLCSGCRRAEVIWDFQNRLPSDLADPPSEALAAERCDECAMYRCQCERER